MWANQFLLLAGVSMHSLHSTEKSANVKSEAEIIVVGCALSCADPLPAFKICTSVL
jgi:hypothetical protein